MGHPRTCNFGGQLARAPADQLPIAARLGGLGNQDAATIRQQQQPTM